MSPQNGPLPSLYLVPLLSPSRRDIQHVQAELTMALEDPAFVLWGEHSWRQIRKDYWSIHREFETIAENRRTSHPQKHETSVTPVRHVGPETRQFFCPGTPGTEEGRATGRSDMSQKQDPVSPIQPLGSEWQTRHYGAKISAHAPPSPQSCRGVALPSTSGFRLSRHRRRTEQRSHNLLFVPCKALLPYSPAPLT